MREQLHPRGFDLVLALSHQRQLLRIRSFGRLQLRSCLLILCAELRLKLAQSFQLRLNHRSTSIECFDFSFNLGSTFQEGFDLLFLIDAFADSPIALQGGIGNGRTRLRQPIFESPRVLGCRAAGFFSFREFGR